MLGMREAEKKGLDPTYGIMKRRAFFHGTPFRNVFEIAATGELRVGPRPRRGIFGVFGTTLLGKALEYSDVTVLGNSRFSVAVIYDTYQYTLCNGFSPHHSRTQFVSRDKMSCGVRSLVIVPR